ncbi:MAG: alpha/beta hydrolase, partial [Candidatus Dormibacteraeota bacterium]|nr:alpha/beta hydrolase [Candidatus Dormibacteraeota bacterium]
AVIAGDYMAPLAEVLARQMRVFVPDLPGCGGSNALRVPTDVAGMAEGLRAWMRREGLEGVLLAGNSFGAQVATALAVIDPPLVSSVVLIGPTMDPTSRLPLTFVTRSIALALTEPIPLHLMWLRDFVRAGLPGALACSRAAWVDHIESRLPLLAAPALVIRGESDRLVSQGWAETVTRTLPRAELKVIAGAGHAAHYSQPEVVGAGILGFARSPAMPVSGR